MTIISTLGSSQTFAELLSGFIIYATCKSPSSNNFMPSSGIQTNVKEHIALLLRSVRVQRTAIGPAETSLFAPVVTSKRLLLGFVSEQLELAYTTFARCWHRTKSIQYLPICSILSASTFLLRQKYSPTDGYSNNWFHSKD